MKKLVYLLVLSLCMNSMAGVASAWLQSARADEVAAIKPEEAKKEKTSKKKKDKKKEKEKKSDKEKQTLVVKQEKEYTLDLEKASQFQLSAVLEYAKLGIKLKEVQKIKFVDKEDKKRLAWEADKENEGDYIFTVLKDFKKVKLNIVTKKGAKLLVLKNGAKAKKEKNKADTGEKKEEPAQQPLEEKKEEPAEPPVEEKKEEPAEPPVEEKKEEPVAPPVEEKKEEPAEPPVEEKKEEPAESPVEEKKEEPAEPPAEEKQDTPEEQSPVNDNETEGVQTESGEKQTEVDTSEGDAKVSDPSAVTEEASQATEEGDVVVTDESGAATDETASPDDAAGDTNDGQSAPVDVQGDVEGSDGEISDGEISDDEISDVPITDDGDAGIYVDVADIEVEQSDASSPNDDNPGNPGESGSDSPGNDGTVDESYEAYIIRNDNKIKKTLAEIIEEVNDGEIVYIHRDDHMTPIFIQEVPLRKLSTVTMIPDPELFRESYNNYSVCISKDNPAIIAQPVLIQPVQMPGLVEQLGEKTDLYIWVRNNAEGQGTAEDKPVITVTATGLAESGWSQVQPLFTLSGIPEGKDWSYVAIIYDERFVPIASDSYVPEIQGIYSLRFAMMDEIGDIISASDQYSLQLDWTPPEVSIESDEETSFKLNISASDEISGVDQVSVDAGKTWHKMTDGEYSVTKDKETTFAAGDIRVTDFAGNVFISEEEVTVSEVEKEEEEGGGEGEGEGGGGSGFGGGGGSGSGSGSAALPHASGDGDEGADYDSLELDLPDEPMKQLEVGGEPLALTLKLESAQDPNAPVGDNQYFTARMRHWADAANDDALNTLVLTAEMDDDLGDAFSYEWRFNGEVYRLLANSGVKYVALQVGDTVAAFPTEGFTGGTKYTELKMQGVSTRKFDYALTMRLNLNPSHVSATSENDYSEKCDMSIRAEVENKNYELSNSPQSMMYFYNVFLGSEDMMDQPFGEYHAAA